MVAETPSAEVSVWRRLWEWWKRVAIKIGGFQARLILTVFYYTVLAPFSMIVRLIDPLSIRKNTNPKWLHREPPGSDLMELVRRQS